MVEAVSASCERRMSRLERVLRFCCTAMRRSPVVGSCPSLLLAAVVVLSLLEQGGQASERMRRFLVFGCCFLPQPGQFSTAILVLVHRHGGQAQQQFVLDQCQ